MSSSTPTTSPPDPGLVPELLVTDLARSLRFWCGLCGFRILYDRPDERFACLDRESARVMLEERRRGRNWIPAPMEPPFGRGVNFEIRVTAIGPILDRLADVAWPLFMQPEEKWYRVGTGEIGVAQFLVQDPDGYLLRFSMEVGQRRSAP